MTAPPPLIPPPASVLEYPTPIRSGVKRWVAMELRVWSLLLAGLGPLAGILVLPYFMSVGAGGSGAGMSLAKPALALGLTGAVVSSLWLWAWAYSSCGRAIWNGGTRAVSAALVFVGIHLMVALVILGGVCWCATVGPGIVTLGHWSVASHVVGGGIFVTVVAGNASLVHMLWCLVGIVRQRD